MQQQGLGLAKTNPRESKSGVSETTATATSSIHLSGATNEPPLADVEKLAQP